MCCHTKGVRTFFAVTVCIVAKRLIVDVTKGHGGTAETRRMHITSTLKESTSIVRGDTVRSIFVVMQQIT